MSLQLARPLVFFDLETTGVDILTDRIIQIAMVKLFPEDDRLEYNELVNPTIPIPPESTAIHHLRDADVAGKPTFAEIAPRVFDFIGDADLAGYNVLRFDLPMLVEEFARVGIRFEMVTRNVIDVYQIFRRRESHSLSRALEFYCGKSLADAHDALADTRATIDVLLGQLQSYPDLEAQPAALHRGFTPPRFREYVDAEGKLLWRDGEVVFGFGNHRNQPLREVAGSDRDYLHWMLASDFSLTVKAIVRQALHGRFPVARGDW